ncbi:2-oxoglutarate dehydrogenase complex dihydrolipoyllysine-residue succinyltransferase [Terricaulis silvestris]|uniref:Dihydrolipoyllysine-residue succinyltransferase component of 2-oxoglutarate dehydrogenase complex n=1 Tax=Terricaulis silvestris TaxID=2686094 RepID=A0A6I6MTZ4_9CAUL|nr:2-oxoglutarate dehydrogenase complex dihydrolipoyllysine-residue succinyltransferase [Terricaulis silvestris]QGZ96926.1 Dihydrolipoyllysine-residue succinyltransferase component of 2-oxoglutarate dehydrogenase complex [Terricaulis silvestris]
MTDIVVPTLGESVSEATVAKWMKKAGDTVRKDETLVELETDKVSVEVSAPEAGVLSEIVAAEGATVNIGAILGRMGGAGAQPAKAEAAPAPKAEAPKPPLAAPPAPQPAAAVTAAKQAPPSVQRIAAEGGVEVSGVTGSGKDGRVTKADALSIIENRGAQSQTPAPHPPLQARVVSDREERVPMTRLRKTIARRLKEAQNTAAMLTTFNEADMSAIMAARNKYKDSFEKKHGVKLGFMSFFVKACIAGLKEIPNVNAEIDGDDIIYKNFYDIGIAVGTDRGLVVPVVRDADHKSMAEIEKEIGELGLKARDGHLKLEDLQGATFTISNGGVYGSLMSTPILNAPQSGILGMHKIQDRPIVIDKQVVVRPMMYLAMSYDHRIVDGKEAVTFLVRVKEGLEDPERMLLDL